MTATTTRAGDEREAFEAWFNPQPENNAELYVPTNYENAWTATAWRAWQARAALATAPEQAGDPDFKALVNRFLMWPLPQTVAADRCATDNKYQFPRSGTNLLNADEAEAMLRHVLTAPPPASTNRLTDEQILAIAWKYHYDDPDASGYDFGTRSLLEFARAIIAATEGK